MGFHSTRLIRFVALVSAFSLVIASAGFGAVFAYRMGIHHSLLLAILSVMMALALEAAKPLAIAFSIRSFRDLKIAQGLALLSLGLVAVAYSLTSELSLVASSRSDLQARREVEAHGAKNARESLQRINSELVALAPTRTTSELDALIQGQLSSRKHLNGCVGWLPSAADRQVCVGVSELQAERGRAERRANLEHERQRLESARSALIHADPGSKSVAIYLEALGFMVSTELVATWLQLVPVLALEVGSAFAMVLVSAVQGGSGVGPGGRTSLVPRTAEPVQLLVGPVGLRDQVASEILRQLVSHGGSIKGSERAIAELIGADRSTVRRAVQELAECGKVSLSTSKRGTAIKLS